MGFFDRFKTDKPAAVPAKLMDDEQARQLKESQDMLGALMAANPGALPDMNATPEAMQASAAAAASESERIQRIQQRGVQAPAVIRSITPTGQTSMGGGQEIEFVVSVESPAGGTHEAQVRQHLLPAQLQQLAQHHPVTVKYDPDDPGTALLVNW